MINSIKNKYFEYNPTEFMPIFYDGKLANARQFHLYKLKRAALRADRALMHFVDAAYAASK